MTSKRRSHEECVQPTRRPAPAGSPKLHVQRSPSRDTVTIRFSALGKEEEDEEEEEQELYSTRVSPTPAPGDESSVVTAVEACEEMFEEEMFRCDPEDAVSPQSSGRPHSSSTHVLSSHIVEQKPSTSCPTKSLSFPSSDRAFPSVGTSLSSDLGTPPTVAPTIRHRQLMKTLVKSLSSDTSQDSSSILAPPYRLPEARLNLQLFRQFTQSRTPSTDPKTAPCSPLTSPDRGGFFKVSEVEARLEDTRRRLSEVISEPLQLLSKIMDEKSSSLASGGAASSSSYRAKALSSSASELCGAPAESNNNHYCIQEEEGGAEWEKESPAPPAADTRSPHKSPVSLEKCSMSDLARQEDEEFCILYSEDFESAGDAGDAGAAGAAGGDPGGGGAAGGAAKVPLSTGPEAGDDPECVEPLPSVPLSTLIAVTLVVYGYFVLPLPSYVGGLLLGAGLGFLLAIGVVWLTGLRPSHRGFRPPTDSSRLWTLTKLDIKEPDMYKVSG